MAFLSNVTSNTANALTLNHPMTSLSHARASYCLISRNTSSTWYGAQFYDGEFRRIGDYVSSYSYYGNTGSQIQYNSTYENVEQMLYSTSATQSNPSSNGTSSYLNATNVMGEFGNYLIYASERGTITGFDKRWGYTGYAGRMQRCFVNSDHQNVNVVLMYDGGYLEAVPRYRPITTNWLGAGYISDRKTKQFTNANLGGNSVGSMWGTASYNAVRKELVILNYDTSNTGRIYVNIWKNIDIDGLNYDVSQIPSTPTNQYFVTTPGWNNDNSEARYNFKVVLCDDGSIWYSVMYASNNFALYKITRVSGDASGNVAQVTSVGLTTSYGRDQGENYGNVAMQTRNGRMVMMFCPYYYYGSGIRSYTVDKRTSNYASYSNSDTSIGYQPVKYRDDSFAIYYAGNFYASNYGGSYFVTTMWPSSTGPVSSGVNLYFPAAPGPNTTNYPGLTSVVEFDTHKVMPGTGV